MVLSLHVGALVEAFSGWIKPALINLSFARSVQQTFASMLL